MDSLHKYLVHQIIERLDIVEQEHKMIRKQCQALLDAEEKPLKKARATEPYTKSMVCRFWLTGECGKTDCEFAHGVDEIRNYKHKPCHRKFAGTCYADPSYCGFSHNIEHRPPLEHRIKKNPIDSFTPAKAPEYASVFLYNFPLLQPLTGMSLKEEGEL